MADLSGFDARNIKPEVGFAPIPPGKYTAEIVVTHLRPTKAGDGRYLQIEFKITHGPYLGRKLWARVNLENASAVAVRMAKAELSAICHAVGVLTPRDSAELHGKRLVLGVDLVEDKATGAKENVIRTYLAAADDVGGIPI